MGAWCIRVPAAAASDSVSPMGEIMEFPSNGTTGQGYLATPEGGSGPGWW